MRKMFSGVPTSDLLLAALLPITVIFVVPISVIANNLDDIGSVDTHFALASLGIIALVCAAFVVVLRWIAGSTVIGTVTGHVIRLLCFFFLLTGLVLPLTGAAGQVETRDIPLDTTNLALATVASLALLLASFSRLRPVLVVSAVMFVSISGAFASFNVYAAFRMSAVDRLVTASSGDNIFVLSFDGLPRDVALELLNEHEEFRSGLSDFTIFSKSVSTAPSTLMSMVYESVGGLDLKKMFDTEDNLEKHLSSLMPIEKYMEEIGYQLSMYYVYSLAYDKPEVVVAEGALTPTTSGDRMRAVGRVFELAMARVLTPQLAFGTGPASQFAALLGSFSTSETRNPQNLIERLKNHKGAEWDAPNIASVNDYEAYVEGMHVGTARPVAQFLHFLHSHFPVDFDSSCTYRSDDATWFQSHQDRDGVKAEVTCNLSQFVRFLAKLKALGIYDRSTIVLKSDHGTPVSYNDPAKAESFKVRGHPYWGYARYTPFLAIKAPHVSQPAPRFDPKPVVLSDLAKTLCLIASPKADCSRFIGYDALNDADMTPDAKYFINLVLSSESTFKMDKQESVPFLRNAPLFDQITDYLTDELLRNPVECGVASDLTTGDQFNNGLTADGRWATWRDADRFFVKWGKPSCTPTAARLTFDIMPPADSAFPLVVRFQAGSGTPVTKSIGQDQVGIPISVDIPMPTGGDTPRMVTATLAATGGAMKFGSLDLTQ